MFYLTEKDGPMQFQRGGWRSGEFVIPYLKDFPLGNWGAAFLRVKCKRDWRCLKNCGMGTEKFSWFNDNQLSKMKDCYLFCLFVFLFFVFN